MSANRLTLNSSKTEFHIIGLKQQLSKIDNSSLNTTHSARNIGFIFDENLTFSDQISSLSKSCYSHIRELRCTIAASIVHSKPDYCNSLCLARTVVISLILSQCRDLRMGVIWEKYRSFNHSTSKTVLNQLKAIYLRLRKIVVERTTVVYCV